MRNLTITQKHCRSWTKLRFWTARTPAAAGETVYGTATYGEAS